MESFRQTLIAEQGNICLCEIAFATFIGLAILFFVMPFAVAFVTRKERLHVPSKRPKINQIEWISKMKTTHTI